MKVLENFRLFRNINRKIFNINKVMRYFTLDDVVRMVIRINSLRREGRRVCGKDGIGKK